MSEPMTTGEGGEPQGEVRVPEAPIGDFVRAVEEIKDIKNRGLTGSPGGQELFPGAVLTGGEDDWIMASAGPEYSSVRVTRGTDGRRRVEVSGTEHIGVNEDQALYAVASVAYEEDRPGSGEFRPVAALHGVSKDRYGSVPAFGDSIGITEGRAARGKAKALVDDTGRTAVGWAARRFGL